MAICYSTGRTCSLCGQPVPDSIPVSYPYCGLCHYTGQGFEDVHAELLKQLKEAGLTAGVWHTGGGCFVVTVSRPEVSRSRFVTAVEDNPLDPGAPRLPDAPPGLWYAVAWPSEDAWYTGDDFEKMPSKKGLDPASLRQWCLRQLRAPKRAESS